MGLISTWDKYQQSNTKSSLFNVYYTTSYGYKKYTSILFHERYSHLETVKPLPFGRTHEFHAMFSPHYEASRNNSIGTVCTCIKGYFILPDIPKKIVPVVYFVYFWKALESKTVSKAFSMHALKIWISTLRMLLWILK